MHTNHLLNELIGPLLNLKIYRFTISATVLFSLSIHYVIIFHWR